MKRHRLVATVLTLALAGCAGPNPPLMFGDTTTFGLRLGSDTAAGGASVSLGYKAQSIAVVPVSVLDETGTAYLLKGHGHRPDEAVRRRDAMSVFASFESAAPKAGQPKEGTVRLGQVFSTGLASQQLSMGYYCRESPAAAACVPGAAKVASEPVPAVTVAGAELARHEPTASERPYQRPLLFLRTDVVGFDIGGTLAEQGLQFTFGYGNRNLALIPVVAQGSGGRVVKVDGNQGTDASDAFSVLGQFRSNTETARLGFGLERFFATGVAARNLGDSLGAAIAKVPLPPAKSASGVD